MQQAQTIIAPSPPTRTAKLNRKPTPKQHAIIKAASKHQDLSTRAIGKLAGADHSTVVRTLAAYGINKDEAEAYKHYRADILAGLQHRLLSSCTDDDIKKAPMGSRVLAAAQLYDKERLERGQSTENVAQITALIDRIRAQDDD